MGAAAVPEVVMSVAAVYVLGATDTVSPGAAAFAAAWIVQ
jgi:hypothetical protein